MKKITFETFIISALLKFNKLNRFDITYLINYLKNEGVEVLVNGKINNIKFFITSKDGCIMLNEYLSFDTIIDYEMTLENYFKSLEDKSIKSLFDRIDIRDFTLKKLYKYRKIFEHEIEKKFNNIQINELYKLEQEGIIKPRFIKNEKDEIKIKYTLTKKVY